MKSNTDKKKQFSIDEIVNSATGIEPPPLFETAEINGVVVKIYSFIREHSKLQNVPMPDKGYDSNDFAMLAAYKNELENQLKLNRQECIKHYDNMKFWLDIHLKRKVKKVQPEKRDTQELKEIIVSVRMVLNMLMHGAEYGNAYKLLTNGSTVQKTTFDSVIFNIDSFFSGSSEKSIKRIERVVSRSTDLYLQYLNLHSQLYQFDADKFLSEQQVGRPEDFPKEKSLKWFNELKKQEEYQHKNGKPHKTKIREEIIRRHTREENGQKIEPSMRQIRRQT